MFLNAYHNKIFDQLFFYITWLGDFVTPLSLFLILLFFRYRYALLMLYGNLLAAGITQMLKHTLFSNAERPKLFFEGSDQLKFVEGVENWLYNSFPSGHTTSAFATFFCLALISNNALNKFLFFIIALSVGYSRIYLSQHFFDDIYAGSLVGVGSIMIVFYRMKRSNKPWLDNALFKNRN